MLFAIAYSTYELAVFVLLINIKLSQWGLECKSIICVDFSIAFLILSIVYK